MRSLVLGLTALWACGPPAPTPVPPLELSIDAAQGHFEVQRQGVGLTGIRPSAWVDGVELVAQGPLAEETSPFEDELGFAEQTRLWQLVGAYRLALVVRRYQEFVVAKVELSCASACPSGARVQGFSLAGQPLVGKGEPTAVLANGYSSWAPTFFAAIQRTADAEEKFASAGNNEQHLVTDARTSWWVSALAGGEGATVSGALTAERWKTRVLTYRRDGIRWKLLGGQSGDSLPIGTQGASSELFFLTAGDLTAGLERYGQAVAQATRAPEEPFVPVGWNSWNTLFAAVTEAKVVKNAELLATLTELAPNNVQVDDGWQKEWGDWAANAKFPSGMHGLANGLAAKGLRAGVWLAPFLVDSRTSLAATHPDWFLRDASGKIISRSDFGGRVQYALDGSHPQARAWMVGQIKAVLAQGYRYLKLDYLYAGAYEGVRADPDQTSLQAYRQTLKEIHAEAAAVGAYLIACGAPILPSSGVAHAVRTGEDIAATGNPYSFAWVKNASRNVAARWFVNPFLVNDPDTALVRGLPDGEKRLQVTTTLLAGRMFALGDDLDTLSAAELDFLRAAGRLPSLARSAVKGQTFVPLDLTARKQPGSFSKVEAFVDPESYFVPSLWAAKTDEGVLLGVLNWSGAEQEFTVELSALGVSGKPKAEELWLGRPLRVTDRELKVSVPAHDAAYIRLR